MFRQWVRSSLKIDESGLLQLILRARKSVGRSSFEFEKSPRHFHQLSSRFQRIVEWGGGIIDHKVAWAEFRRTAQLSELASPLLYETNDEDVLAVVLDVARSPRPEMQRRIQLGDDKRPQISAR